MGKLQYVHQPLLSHSTYEVGLGLDLWDVVGPVYD